MEYRVKFTWENAAGNKKDYRIVQSCREVGIDSLSRRMSDEHTGEPNAKNIVAVFEHMPNKYVREIAERMELQFEDVNVADAFNQKSAFMISGNDRLIIPAWYWIVVALRYNGEEFTTFHDLLKRAKEQADNYRSAFPAAKHIYLSTLYYYNIYVADRSCELWGEFLEGGKTPTSDDMLRNGQCVIEYYDGAEANSEYDEDYEEDYEEDYGEAG